MPASFSTNGQQRAPQFTNWGARPDLSAPSPRRNVAGIQHLGVMDNPTAAHANASAVIQALYDSGSDHPNVRDRGRPEWFYELAARISLLVGDAPILFASHSFNGSPDQDGEAWVFTEDIVVIATLKGNERNYDLAVEAFGRASLTRLVVERISDPLKDRADWPDDLSALVEYASGRGASLPLASYSYRLPQLAQLIPSLAKDLNK
jgi:hypothetical protein